MPEGDLLAAGWKHRSSGLQLPGGLQEFRQDHREYHAVQRTRTQNSHRHCYREEHCLEIPAQAVDTEHPGPGG